MSTDLTVLMLLYNRPIYMQQAIESVIEQTYSDFKLLLLDNGSTGDEVFNIAEQYAKQDQRIEIFREKVGLGLAKGRRALFDKVQTEYFATIEDDDYWQPTKLAKQMETMLSNESLAAVACSYTFVDSNSNPIGEKLVPTGVFPASRQTDALANSYYYNGSGQLFRTKAIQEVNGWRDFFEYADDLDLFFRLNEQYGFASLSEKLVNYRLWSENTHLKSDAWIYTMMTVISALFRRIGEADPVANLSSDKSENVRYIVDHYFDVAKYLPAKLCFRQARSFLKALYRSGEKGLAKEFARKFSSLGPSKYKLTLSVYSFIFSLQYRKNDRLLNQ